VPIAPRITSMPSLTSSDATPTSETEASPQTVTASTRDRGKSEGGVADVLLMAAYAMTELHAEESPTKTVGSDGSVLRSSPKRKSSEFALSVDTETMNGGGTAYESPPKLFPDSSVQQDDRDASPATTSESPLMTPAEQRKSKRSRVGTHKKPAVSKKKGASRGTDKSSRYAKRVDNDKNKSPASSKSKSPSAVQEEQDEVAATPTTRSRSKMASKDVLTPVSARCIDFRLMDVKDMKQGGSDVSDESKAEQMEIAA